MNKIEKIAFASLAVIAVTSTGFAYGQSAQQVPSANSIYACVKAANGAVLQMSATKIACAKGAKLLTWSTAGPKGDQGIQGFPGVAGPKGDAGSSATTPVMTYVVNESGSKYPVFYGPVGPAVQISGIEYSYTNDPKYPISNFRSDHDFSFKYQSPNCDGTPLVSYKAGEAPPLPNTAYTGPDGHSITLSSQPDVKAESLRSFQTSQGCFDLDLSYWSNAYSVWLTEVLAAWNQIASSSNPTDASFVASFASCSIDASWNDYWGRESIHTVYTGCTKSNSSQSQTLYLQWQAAKSVLAIRDNDAVYIGFDRSSFAGWKVQAPSMITDYFSPTSAELYTSQPAPFDAFTGKPVTGWNVVVE
jgi:hypothetical protein